LAAAACSICCDGSSERNTFKKIDIFMSPTARRTRALTITRAVMMIPVVAQNSRFFLKCFIPDSNAPQL